MPFLHNYFVSLFVILLVTDNNSAHRTKQNDVCDSQEEDSDNCKNSYDFTIMRINAHETGNEEEVLIKDERYVLRTLSIKPEVFEVEDFLTSEECEHFIDVAKSKGLQKSVTYRNRNDKNSNIILRDLNKDKRLSIDEMMLTLEDSFDMYFTEDDILKLYESLDMDKNGDRFITPEELSSTHEGVFQSYLEDYVKTYPHKKSRFSKQIWLFADTEEDKVFKNVQERVQTLTKLHPALIKKSDFQVVNYGPNGHYNAHHDSSPLDKKVPCCTRKQTRQCRICRFMTVLFYLNDVEKGGETAFPVAGNETYNGNKFIEQHQQNLMQHCDKANLKVPPKKGKAVLWYNHFIDSKTQWVGDMDPFTWHGGCPVNKGEKWIANFWIKFTDSVEESYET